MPQIDMPFHDAAKALSHCELCIHQVLNKNISYADFEFFYTSFMFEINRFRELVHKQLIQLNNKEILSFSKKIERKVDIGTPFTDPLLAYVRYARNQLGHERKNILWNSSDEGEVEGLGVKENMGEYYNTKSIKCYSTSVLPSLQLNFVATYIAAKPVVAIKKGKKIELPVPNQCCGNIFENTPRNIMICAYKFYGQNFDKIVDWSRKVNI